MVWQMGLLFRQVPMALKQLSQLRLQMFQELQQEKYIINRLAKPDETRE